MCMSYHPAHAQMKILEKTYPDTVRTFVLEEGTISNTHFTAVPFNAPNKAGALVLSAPLIRRQLTALGGVDAAVAVATVAVSAVLIGGAPEASDAGWPDLAAGVGAARPIMEVRAKG